MHRRFKELSKRNDGNDVEFNWEYLFFLETDCDLFNLPFNAADRRQLLNGDIDRLRGFSLRTNPNKLYESEQGRL